MGNKIWIIGIGPGSKEYLTQAAIDKVNEQDLLVGSQKALDMFADLNKEDFKFKQNIDELINFLKNNFKKKKVAVLVTGDPGIFSLANLIKKHFNTKNLDFIPGISSVQLFFAKLGLSYEDVKIISIHGRQITDLITQFQDNKRVCLLTDGKNNPKKVAQLLVDNNIKARTWIGQNISLPEEVIAQKDLVQLSMNGDLANSLMYLEIEDR